MRLFVAANGSLRALLFCLIAAGLLTSCSDGSGDRESEGNGNGEEEEELFVTEEPVAYDDLDWSDNRFYYNGKPFTGTTFAFHKDGTTRKKEGTLRNGVYHGVYREWWDNGQIQTETNFTKGTRDGKNTYWDKDGSLIKEQVYEMGKSVEEKFYK